MSYNKLKITYYTDGVNTQSCVNTRQGNKHRTLSLPQKVQEYGDRYGYNSISLNYSYDHLILRGGGEVLMDIDISGIVSYKLIC